MTGEDLYYILLDKLSIKISKEKELKKIEKKLEDNYHFCLLRKILSPRNEFDKMLLESIRENILCDNFSNEIICKALEYGFYPMSLSRRCLNFKEFEKSKSTIKDILMIRHHFKKLIITPQTFKIPSNTKKYIKNNFKDYTLRFNHNFERCLRNITVAYPDNWICDKLFDAFVEVNQTNNPNVSIDSVEIYNPNGEMVAGEIGFISKDSYASLTGFHFETNTGTVQMSILGKYLFENGFKYWDLGMELDYKYRYGAINCNRKQQEEFLLSLGKEKLSLPKNEIKLIEFL